MIFQVFKLCFSYYLIILHFHSLLNVTLDRIQYTVDIMRFLQRRWISLWTRYSVIWMKRIYLNIKHHYNMTLCFSRATIAQQRTVFWINVRSSTLTRGRSSSLIQNIFRGREMFVIICPYLLFLQGNQEVSAWLLVQALDWLLKNLCLSLWPVFWCYRC